MNLSNIKIVTLIALFGTNLHAADNVVANDIAQPFSLLATQSNDLNSLNVNNEWISANHKDNTPVFTLKANKNTDFGNEVAFAWSLSDSIIINLNLFESQLNLDTTSRHDTTPQNYSKNLSKNFGKPVTPFQAPTFDTNRNVSGYNFGISSKFGMGNSTILNIDFNYGQLVDVNSTGFTTPEVNTSSFALGFRKAKFGASFQTDSFLENNVDVMDNTRLGIEFDWYFSDDTTISFGSKQRINSKQTNGSSSLDSLTGDVQYIKFQHNL